MHMVGREGIVTDNCNRHLFELTENHCRECRKGFCGDCLVYTNGGDAPPMCINCALKQSGIRGSKRTKPSWKARRAMAKVEKAHRKARTQEQERVEALAMDAEPTTDDAQDWDQLDDARWDLRTL